VVQCLLPGATKRRREISPPEVINSEDDQRHEDYGRRVREQVSEDESSYKSSQRELPAEENN
jgi:hypothetical protein